ncbi:MAG: radical SAM protein [Phycisphaerae bacterium]|nr:radical SAM protein [Phycisphaerae bacterium]NIS54047.1 radical SAM protein [Phycisphaerae bacterium]NIU11270.1 radical SAM protein [Phycisphaerae bacterium]NIU59095.1 radical SAM protein [Phycisphaerae bacterium]NIV01857.1 radical SAM protein [Phycisphaerae bacterium]
MALPPTNTDSFSDSVQKLWDLMNPCTLCPRNCKVDRTNGQTGFCGIADMPVVSSVGPHFGEESVLVGRGGSGTIFFAGCNLGCIFCQNSDISHQRHGSKVTIEEIAEAMLGLQKFGCCNINFVTPTHVVPTIAAAIETARKKGLALPTVYNTGGYDSVETLKLLDGFIDIYMPDMKYSDSGVADELSSAPDYPQINQTAVREMHRQVGDLTTKNSVATHGLLVRHLVLPENLAGSIEIIDFLSEQISPKTTINVMDQYRPCFQASSHTKINRRPSRDEFQSAQQYALQKGLNVLL